VSTSAIADVVRLMRGEWPMSRILLALILLAAVAPSLVATPARAQFEFLFGNPPPRPPQAVPGGRQPQQQQYQQQPQYQGQPPQTLQQPGAPRPQRPQQGVQSEPLAPPPGGNAAPPPQRAQRPAQQTQPQPEQPASVPDQPSDEVALEPPGTKVPNPTGVFSGLDKITGRITSFDVAVNETVQFGALQVTPRACYTRPATETPHTDAFIEVDEVTLQGEIKRIYTGWMFAASPGLHAVEHPIYDVWLNDCKGAAAVAEVQPDPTPAAARPAARPQQPAQPRPPAPQQRRPPQQQQQF
jgi:hypothetical protein